MPSGTVKCNPTKGYGFIQPNGWHQGCRRPYLDVIDNKARRCQRRGMGLTAHLRCSPKRLKQPLCPPRHADRCTKSESEPNLNAD